MINLLRQFFCVAFCTISFVANAQQQTVQADSSKTMDEVLVSAFETNRMVSFGTIVSVIGSNSTAIGNKTSLVPAFNAIAGARMEERSPGSLRINIRGSSLRSPFGVRNVKIYWNDIPVTDAGGNTYFNQFSLNNFSSLQMFKGPAGSMYGAGTGGLLLLHSFTGLWQPAVSIEYITGSYGLQNLLLSAGFGEKNRRTWLSFNHAASDGYRDHSSSRKNNISLVSQLAISERQQLTASVLYNDVFYETPGALTLTEFLTEPQKARPAAGNLPGAADAQAAIHQKNFTAGISNKYLFCKDFTNTITVFSTYAQIQNPTFRNYERRSEPGFGARASFVYEKKMKGVTLQLVSGAELQKGFFNTQVSKNKNGQADSLQTDDDIDYVTTCIFTQADVSIKDKWIITAGISINQSKAGFSRLNVYPVLKQERTYKNEWSPRLALQRKLNDKNVVFASVARGFSPPTIAELLPSTGVINTYLEAEEGINYELGARFFMLKHKLRMEVSGFYFTLNNALVSRKDSSNADYFINAGNTRQKGAEVSTDYQSSFNSRLLKAMNIKAAYTFSEFKYHHFKKADTDFSGRALPGVPQHTLSLLANLICGQGIYLNCNWYYASRVFLNDANTAVLAAYNLAGMRLGWKRSVAATIDLHVYTGVDNLFNKIYSPGSDINAAGGRYYNAAPQRNFYAGVSLQWNHAPHK